MRTITTKMTSLMNCFRIKIGCILYMSSDHGSNIPSSVVSLTQLVVDTSTSIFGSGDRGSLFFPPRYDFKRDHAFADRLAESKRILSTYPDRIPVSCQKAPGCKIEDLDRHKYLVPMDLTVGQFLYVIRKRMKLDSEAALFLFIDNVLPAYSQLISTTYEQSKDSDGFLYINFSTENTFG